MPPIFRELMGNNNVEELLPIEQPERLDNDDIMLRQMEELLWQTRREDERRNRAMRVGVALGEAQKRVVPDNLEDRLRRISVDHGRDIELSYNNNVRFYEEYQDEDGGWFDAQVFLDKFEKPCVPELAKEVVITEDDEMPVNYDIDDDAERAELPENKSFYADTKGKLDQVSVLFTKLSDDLLPYLEKDKFFTENGLATKRYVNSFLLNALWVLYREEGNKKKNTFPSIDEVKKTVHLHQLNIDYNVKANTYIYKEMESIVGLVNPVFDAIIKIGSIKLTPKGNTVSIDVNGETYSGDLDIKYVAKKPLGMYGASVAMTNRRPAFTATVNGNEAFRWVATGGF